MAETVININGGNNQILPEATHAILHIHIYTGTQSEKSKEETAPEACQFSLYLDKVENLPRYLMLLSECRSAHELAQVVMEMLQNEPKITAEEIVKERFIKKLIPLTPKITKGTSVDNIRARINDAYMHYRKRTHNSELKTQNS
ncbi:MAG: hypothetical protein IJZ38_00270 [Bacteroides sp.]|nr:hypothetical protein [Bacteroides sp.]